METNVASSLSNQYVIKLPFENKDLLGSIRNWKKVSIAYSEKHVWVNGLNDEEIQSKLICSIPGIIRYALKDNRLFLFGSKVPTAKMPSLLWTPIQRAMPLRFPKMNHNYFGNYDDLQIDIVKSDVEHKSDAMTINLDDFERYMSKAPQVRTSNLKWCLLNKKSILIVGYPLLPIPGDVYWTLNDHLIPSGYTFNFENLSSRINGKINPENDQFIFWLKTGNFIPVLKTSLEKLSIGSYRSTWSHVLNKQKIK
jgi:hypothetical protein